jgi:hypothetical protein
MKSLDSICNVVLVFILQWETEIYTGISVRNVGYTRHEVPWFLEKMDIKINFVGRRICEQHYLCRIHKQKKKKQIT